MLVLTRKNNEKIHVGENITITVLRIKGTAISLGIEAPQGVRILRGELKLKDDSSSLTASTVETAPLADIEGDDGEEGETRSARLLPIGDLRAKRQLAGPLSELREQLAGRASIKRVLPR